MCLCSTRRAGPNHQGPTSCLRMLARRAVSTHEGLPILRPAPGVQRLPYLLMAEFDEVATGERTPGLLQPATRRETAEVDRREAETLDELFDECGGFGMVARDEDHATSSVLDRPFIESGSDDRIERLDDAGAWRQSSHYLAGALAAEIGEDELRTRLDEGIRRIDEHPALPGG